MSDKKRSVAQETEENKDERAKSKKQKRKMKQVVEETYLDEMLNDVEDDQLYSLIKKIK